MVCKYPRLPLLCHGPPRSFPLSSSHDDALSTAGTTGQEKDRLLEPVSVTVDLMYHVGFQVYCVPARFMNHKLDHTAYFVCINGLGICRLRIPAFEPSISRTAPRLSTATEFSRNLLGAEVWSLAQVNASLLTNRSADQQGGGIAHVSRSRVHEV